MKGDNNDDKAQIWLWMTFLLMRGSQVGKNLEQTRTKEESTDHRCSQEAHSESGWTTEIHSSGGGLQSVMQEEWRVARRKPLLKENHKKFHLQVIQTPSGRRKRVLWLDETEPLLA